MHRIPELLMKRYLSNPGRVKRMCLSLAKFVCLCLILSGCSLRFGGVQSVTWYLGMVEGSTVEPGLRSELQGSFQRSLAQRRIQQGQLEARAEILEMVHQPLFASPSSELRPWKSRLSIRLTVHERSECLVDITVERAWMARIDDPYGATHLRVEIVENLVQLASERALDRLLGNASCR